MLLVNTVRTVSDTKRAFYNLHTRPIHSIYRRVIEELLVEAHLLSVNADFHYDPIYALGVVASFHRFMQSYRPEQDQDSIFNALVQALDADPQQYRQDAAALEALATRSSVPELVSWLHQPQGDGSDPLQNQIQQLFTRSRFKYSRLFGIGLLSLLELSDPELVKDEKQRFEALKPICDALHLPEDKLKKDLELYRSNLEKMAQAQSVIEDMLKADRKQREQRAQAQAAAGTADDSADSASSDKTPSA